MNNELIYNRDKPHRYDTEVLISIKDYLVFVRDRLVNGQADNVEYKYKLDIEADSDKGLCKMLEDNLGYNYVYPYFFAIRIELYETGQLHTYASYAYPIYDPSMGGSDDYQYNQGNLYSGTQRLLRIEFIDKVCRLIGSKLALAAGNSANTDI